MKDIDNLIKYYNGEIYDLCYKLLYENEKHEEIFSYVCNNFVKEPIEKNIFIESHFDEAEIERLISLYGDTVNGLIASTIKKCDYGILSPDDFYKNLWDYYSSIFLSLEEKAFAFYYTIIDKKIPYTYLGKPLSMEQERYEEVRNNNQEFLNKIDKIFAASYAQKTETASLVLQCIDSVDDYEAKVICLVRAMDLYGMKKVIRNTDIERMIDHIEKKIKEIEQQDSESDQK